MFILHIFIAELGPTASVIAGPCCCAGSTVSHLTSVRNTALIRAFSKPSHLDKQVGFQRKVSEEAIGMLTRRCGRRIVRVPAFEAVIEPPVCFFGIAPEALRVVVG